MSHASADKPRIKPVLIELIRHGVRLWIDKPYDDRLQLSENLFAGWIERRVAGETQESKDQITNALRAAHGVIVFPSPASKVSEQVNVEIGISHEKRANTPNWFQITPCFLDADAFGAAEWRVGGIQGFSTFIETTADGRFVLTDSGRREVADLSVKLKHHLEFMKQRLLRHARYGHFDSTEGAGGDQRLTAEQVGTLLSMLDRETAVHDLVERHESLMVLSGDHAAGVRHLTRRLPLIELPLKTCTTTLTDLSGENDAARLKASLVCGAISEAGRTWQPRSLAWCDDTKRSPEEAFSDIAARLIASFGGGSVSPRDVKTLGLRGLLRKKIDQGRKRTFVWTEVSDKPHLRRRNETVIQKLHEELVGIDRDWFRLLINVPPSSPIFGIQKTCDWLDRRVARWAGPARPVRLQFVSREQLIEWEHLAMGVVSAPSLQIQESIDEIFQKRPGRGGLPYSTVEESLRPVVMTWRAQKSRSGESRTPKQKVWADE